MRNTVWAALVLVGCGGDGGDPTASTNEGPWQGAVGRVRSVDGERIDADGTELAAGASRSALDAAGLLVFDQELPGILGVVGKADGHTRSGAGAPVVLDRLSAVGVDLLPTTSVDGGALTTAGPFELEMPDGMLVDGSGQPFTGPWTVAWAMPEGDERWSSPGDSVLLYDDVLEKPIHPHHPLYLQGHDGEDRLRIEGDAPFVMDLPAGSPVGDGWRVLHFSFTTGRWSRGELVTLDAEGRAHTTIRNFGWIAFGLEDAPLGCVTGRVETPDGTVADGAEVRLLEPGALGATRGWVDGGRFCAPLTVGATADARLLWFSPTFDTMGVAEASVTHPGGEAGECGSAACVDVGTLVLEVGRDADDDHYFSGPGGDCDDTDPDVNPSFAYGDGTWCAE